MNQPAVTSSPDRAVICTPPILTRSSLDLSPSSLLPTLKSGAVSCGEFYMHQFTDAFKAMTLREFLLEPRLAEEFQAARFLSWLGGKLA